MPDHTEWTCMRCGRVWAPTQDECAVCNGATVHDQTVTPLRWYQFYYYPQCPGAPTPTITWSSGTTAVDGLHGVRED